MASGDIDSITSVQLLTAGRYGARGSGGEDVDLFAPFKDSTLDGMGPAVVQEPIKKKKLSEATTTKTSLEGFFD